MNKTSQPPSPKPFPLRQYLQVLKSRSKDRTLPPTRTSKSPPHPAPPPKIEGRAESQELLALQRRYLELQEKYRQLLQRVQVRNGEHERMKNELAEYQRMHERDTDHIEKLRCIIGLVKKKSVQTQVDEEQIQFANGVRISRNNKFDQSTEDDIKFRQSAQKFHSKDKLSPAKLNKHSEPPHPENRIPAKQQLSTLLASRDRQQTQKTQLNRGIFQQYERELQQSGRFGKKLSNSPYSKLRFVPGVRK